MDLSAVISGKEAPPPGVEVRRCKLWPSVVATVVLIAFGLWAYDYVFSGQMTHIRGKTALGLIMWPFIVLFWVWNSIRGWRFRAKGMFGWAVSNTHFLYVPAEGKAIGEIALTTITKLAMVKRPAVGDVVEVVVPATVLGHVVPMSIVMGELGEGKLGLLALRPSNSKDLFVALARRLKAINSTAEIENLSIL